MSERIRKCMAAASPSLTLMGKPFNLLYNANSCQVTPLARNPNLAINLLAVARFMRKEQELLSVTRDMQVIELRDVATWSRIAQVLNKRIDVRRMDGPDAPFMLHPVYIVYPDGTVRYTHGAKRAARRPVQKDEVSDHQSYRGAA